MRYMLVSALPNVPYNEWLIVMLWLGFSSTATLITVIIPSLRQQTWSLYLLYGLEAVSDLIYLWFNLYSLRYIHVISVLGDTKGLSVTASFIVKIVISLLNVKDIIELLGMFVTMIRLMYFGNIIHKYILHKLQIIPSKDKNDEINVTTMLQEILKDNMYLKVLFYTCKYILQLIVIIVVIGYIGFVFYFVSEYVKQREYCLEVWGETAKYCDSKTYYVNGFWEEPKCSCIQISIPDCYDETNKTLNEEIFITTFH